MSNLRIVHEMRSCQFTHCPAKYAIFAHCSRSESVCSCACVDHATSHANTVREVCENCAGSMRKLCGKYAQTMREMCAVVAQSIRNLDVN